MKINEVITKSDKALFEEIDRDNETGFLTEDLVCVVRADQGEWKQFPADFASYLKDMVSSAK